MFTLFLSCLLSWYLYDSLFHYGIERPFHCALTVSASSPSPSSITIYFTSSPFNSSQSCSKWVPIQEFESRPTRTKSRKKKDLLDCSVVSPLAVSKLFGRLYLWLWCRLVWEYKFFGLRWMGTFYVLSSYVVGAHPLHHLPWKNRLLYGHFFQIFHQIYHTICEA